MAKNFFSTQPKQMAFSMSSPYPHTVSAVAGQSSLDEEDDNDICPVCDGECTCSNNVSHNVPSPHLAATATGPLTMEELSRQYKVVTSSSTPTSQQRTPQLHQHSIPKPSGPKPSLKIKFTVPQSLLAKRRATPNAETTPRPNQYLNQDETMFAEESDDDEPLAGPSSFVRPPAFYNYTVKPAPKKRGRPRKVLPSAARDLSVDSIPARPSTSPSHRRINPKTSIIGRQKQPTYATKVVKSTKKRPPPPKKRGKKAGPKRRRPSYLDSDASSESSLTDDDDMDIFGLSHSYDAGEVHSGRFPTFVSASALSSLDSDNDSSDSSSLSGFSDSSMQNEEEGFIVSDMQQRTRANREFVGDNARKSQSNEWVIRPRKKSVGLSDAEVDSDATEDEDEAEAHVMAEANEDEEGDETDGHSVGGSGLVTGWSEEDEESSFDADLFFANLSTTSDSDSSSDESMRELGLDDGDDDTVSDASTEAGFHQAREGLENLPLELTEGWDGQLVFTNGLPNGGTALIDLDFERDASKFIVPAESPYCSDAPGRNQPGEHDSDVDMTTYGSDGDDGYATDGGEGEGDTTDEELVGDDDLPNERAMRLFNFPLSVNSINPLSTVSPMVTPARNRFISGPPGPPPTPADILSGNVFYDSDDMDEMFDETHRRKIITSSKGSRGGPRQGVFMVVQEARRQAVIDDQHAAIPSPHPRFNRNRRGRKLNAIEALIRKHFSMMKNEPTLVASPASVTPDSATLRLLPSVEITTPNGNPSAAEGASNDTLTPIELDDVLDASFLHPDPTDSSHGNGDSTAEGPPESATADDDSDSNNKEVKHLHRWDVISVSAFRQTREHATIMDSPGAPGWTPGSRRTPGSSADYGLKASPFSAMLWPTNKKPTTRREGKGLARAMSASPLLQPTGADGDATPTGKQTLTPHQQQFIQGNHQDKFAHKSKKELKKEKKLKRKGFNGHGHHASHHHHSHHHHPNSKSRGTGSVQRSNFMPSVPPLNL